MSEVKTNIAEERAARLEALFDKMSAFVCEHGPMLLTRGMPALEANEAIMACLEKLLEERNSGRAAVDLGNQGR